LQHSVRDDAGAGGAAQLIMNEDKYIYPCNKFFMLTTQSTKQACWRLLEQI
jgi:hypothetical protein